MDQQTPVPWTKEALMEVAIRQKNILWFILLSFVAMFHPVTIIAAGLIQSYFLYKLVIAVRSAAGFVYIILIFIPCLGLLGLLHLNGTATNILRSNGIKVGFMGARMSDFENIP